MPELLKIIILAVVQGCAEFLPISSSGHLAVISYFMDIDCDVVTLSIVLHAGTLLAILIYYFQFILRLVRKRDKRLLVLVAISTVPTAIFGLLVKKSGMADELFNQPVYSGVGLIITGLIIICGLSKVNDEGDETHAMTIPKALIVGMVQGLAIFPGISRSGSTISVALKLGLRSEDAATYSFMLAIPVIAGASLLELLSVLGDKSGELGAIALEHLVIGFIVSAVVGFFSLRLLIRTLRKNKLSGYAYYCIIVGFTVIGWDILN